MNMNMSKEEFLLALHKEGLLIYGTTWLENFKRLQELKKHKEMWEELENCSYRYRDIANNYAHLDDFMNNIKQKYFPKPKSKYERINNILEQLTPPGAAIDIKELKNLLIELRDEGT